MKKKFALLLIPILLLSGCKPAVIDIADTIKTSLPCVDMQSVYHIEEYELDESAAKAFNEYGLPQGFYKNELYLMKSSVSENEAAMLGIKPSPAVLASYDIQSGKVTELFSESSDDPDSSISYYPAVFNDEDIYYYKMSGSYNGVSKTELCRFDSNSKKSEPIFTFSEGNNGIPDAPTVLDDALYFEDIFEINYETGDYSCAVYKYDMTTGKTEIYSDDAEDPQVYDGRVVYYRDGMYYDGDDALFAPNPDDAPRVSDILFANKTIAYIYTNDSEDGYVLSYNFGVYDDDFHRKDIASTAADDLGDGLVVPVCQFSRLGGLNGLVTLVGADIPLVYDTENERFLGITVKREQFYSMTNNNSLMIMGYNSVPDSLDAFVEKPLIYVLNME